MRIYHRGALLKVHPRQPRGRTDRNDYPAELSPYTLRAPEHAGRAAELGEATGAFAERLFEGPLPWAKLRQGHKPSATPPPACLRALEVDLIDVRRLERSSSRPSTRRPPRRILGTGDRHHSRRRDVDRPAGVSGRRPCVTCGTPTAGRSSTPPARCASSTAARSCTSERRRVPRRSAPCARAQRPLRARPVLPAELAQARVDHYHREGLLVSDICRAGYELSLVVITSNRAVEEWRILALDRLAARGRELPQRAARRPGRS